MIGGQIVATHAIAKQLPLFFAWRRLTCLSIFFVFGMEKTYMSINHCQSQASQQS